MARAELVDRVIQDAKFAVRTFARAPMFTAAALLTLGIGIGANTAVFSVVNAVLLRPFPFKDPDGVISVWMRNAAESGSEYDYFAVAVPEYRDYARTTRVMSDVAAYRFQRANLAGGSDLPDRVGTVPATANLFRILGVDAALGRTFRPGEDRAGAPCVVVIGDGLWRQRFGGQRNALGQTLRVDGQPCTVIGVMPAGFFFPIQEVQVWRPFVIDATPDLAEDRGSHWIMTVARLKPGATLSDAQAELGPMMAAWRQEHEHHRGHFIILQPFREDIIGDDRPILLLVLGGVALVLLIICANIANLLMARAEGRRREMAVRVALGAGRGRLIRQLLTESMLLAGAGGALALLVSPLLLALLTRVDATAMPTGNGPIGLDARVLAFTIAIAFLTGLLFGLVPAFQLSTLRLQQTLKTEARGTTVGQRGIAVRRGLVVFEIALSLAIVVAAALMVRSYQQMQRVDLGFDPRNVLTMDITLPAGDYPERERVQRFYEELRARIAQLPGVRSVGMLSVLPLRTFPPSDSYRIEGRPEPQTGDPDIDAGYNLTSPGALEALGLKLTRGRAFDARDVSGAPLVAIIDETAVRMHFGNADPIGRRIRYYGADSAWITVVGVVSDVRYISAREQPRANVYVPHAQMPRRFYTGHDMTVIVRASGDVDQLIAGVRAATRSIDATVPITRIASMEDVIARANGQPRFAAGLMGLFGLIALLVGALGVYGIMSYIVQSRVNEIGIRMALGANARVVLFHILGQGMALAGAGIVMGTAVTLLATRVLSKLVFGVDVRDAPTFLLTIVVLGSAALLASWLPARRATRVDPLTALRS